MEKRASLYDLEDNKDNNTLRTIDSWSTQVYRNKTLNSNFIFEINFNKFTFLRDLESFKQVRNINLNIKINYNPKAKKKTYKIYNYINLEIMKEK